VSRYQKGKTNLDFTEARDSEWQWHQLGHMKVCTLFQTDNHASTPPLSFFTGRMPFLLPNQQRQSTEGFVTQLHTHPFNGPFSWTTRVGRYQKGKTNLDFTEARDSKWQWHQLSHMQVCTLFQTDNHAKPHRSVFLQAGCPSCCPTNSVKALKADKIQYRHLSP